MTPVLQLPSLVAGWDLANEFVDRLGNLEQATATVDARHLTRGTSSFASQLVRRILLEGHADRLVIIGGPTRFVHRLREAATAYDVSDKLDTVDTLRASAVS